MASLLNGANGSSASDDVLTLHSFDDTALNRIMAVTGMLRYDAVLDADKLRDSLVDLLHIGEWKKLRGRLRLNVSTSEEFNKLALTLLVPRQA